MSGRHRYRITFGKDGPQRFTSHLDLARTWERVLRRAGVPLAYSQGFNPRPKIQLAAALPLGYASICEVVDIWVECGLERPDSVVAWLRETAPEGLDIKTLEPVEHHAPAMQSLTDTATYVVIPDDVLDQQELGTRVTELMAQPEIWRERRGKQYNLRPLIHELKVLPDEPLSMQMVLALSQKMGTARPDDVLAALGVDPVSARITRTAISAVPG